MKFRVSLLDQWDPCLLRVFNIDSVEVEEYNIFGLRFGKEKGAPGLPNLIPEMLLVELAHHAFLIDEG
jgi:hypothetical protein